MPQTVAGHRMKQSHKRIIMILVAGISLFAIFFLFRQHQEIIETSNQSEKRINKKEKGSPEEEIKKLHEKLEKEAIQRLKKNKTSGKNPGSPKDGKINNKKESLSTRFLAAAKNLISKKNKSNLTPKAASDDKLAQTEPGPKISQAVLDLAKAKPDISTSKLNQHEHQELHTQIVEFIKQLSGESDLTTEEAKDLLQGIVNQTTPKGVRPIKIQQLLSQFSKFNRFDQDERKEISTASKALKVRTSSKNSNQKSDSKECSFCSVSSKILAELSHSSDMMLESARVGLEKLDTEARDAE